MSVILISGWHMLTRDHTVLPATHTLIHEWNEPSCLYSPAAEHHRTLLIYRPAVGRRLSWPDWLVTHRRVICPPRDGHPSKY